MTFPFHLVIDYAHQNRSLTDTAFLEFFKESGVPNEEQAPQAFPLFAEWLIFDYVKPNGSTFLAEYYLKNPDNLDQDSLSYLEQILQTQQYGGFEIISVNRGQWIELEHLFFGKKVKVFDHVGSLEIATEGMIISRIARVNNKQYIIGSNPFYLPQSFTKRLKNTLKGQHAYPSPIETWKLFSTTTVYAEPENLSYQDILKKRKSLEVQYEKIAKKNGIKLTFNQLSEFVYEENGKRPFDFWTMIMKKGLPEEVFYEHSQLFQDIWNYFPHKALNDKSPVELFQNVSKNR